MPIKSERIKKHFSTSWKNSNALRLHLLQRNKKKNPFSLWICQNMHLIKALKQFSTRQQKKKASRPRLLNFKLDSFFSFPVETIHDFCLKSCETAQKEELNITVQHLRFRGLWPSYLNRCVKDFCTISWNNFRD